MLYLLCAIVIILTILFLFRSSIAYLVFRGKASLVEKRFSISINVDELRIRGIRNIAIGHVFVTQTEGLDTLFTANSVQVKLSLPELVFLKANPLEISMENPTLKWSRRAQIRRDTGRKADNPNDSIQLDGHESNSHKRSINISNYSNVLRALFGVSTARIHLRNLNLYYSDSALNLKIHIPQFESNEHGFRTSVHVDENGTQSELFLYAQAQKNTSQLSIKAFGPEKARFPFVAHKLGFSLCFDTARVTIQAEKLGRSEVLLAGTASARGIEIVGKRIAESTVRIRNGELHFRLSATAGSFTIDSSSLITLNSLPANIFFQYMPNPNRYVRFRLETPEIEAQRLFESLPQGLFTNLEGIKTRGKLRYHLSIGIDLDNPDSLALNGKLHPNGFGIVNYGRTNFAVLNDTFTHHIYNDTGLVRSILIGKNNPKFRPIEQISPYIRNAVITSEDGGFYHHRGFDLDGIRYALSANIRQGQLVRGGSTITMQLVKNLFLNQNKNILRKIEEYLIVWLIENEGIVPKDRMLEIYLNIIEWGPGVYGVTEACRYYFDKDPMQVTLDEAIFLACIIPRPSKVKYFFEKDGNLKGFMDNNYTFIGTKMLQRGTITEDDYNNLARTITLRGDARFLLRDPMLVPHDTVGFSLDH